MQPQPQHQHEVKDGLLHGLVWTLLAAFFLVLANCANAAKPVDRSGLLFPYYEVYEVLNSTVTGHYQKTTAGLLHNLEQLDTGTAQYCKGNAGLGTVKVQYAKTYLAWLELSSVVMGPMLEKNTVRQMDFRPLRVNLLERAIKKQPKGAQDMALVGSPAKGFPALEYLLVQPQFKPASAECAYALEVVQDMTRTVRDLQWQRLEIQAGEEDEQAVALSAEMQLYFNQLVGALHNLAWERMEKPLLKARDESVSKRAASWPFADFNLTERTWAAQWQGVEPLLVLNSSVVPQAAQQVVPLEAYLRGLGQIGLADTLAMHCDKVSATMLANSIGKPATIEQSVKAVKALKGFLEQEVAQGLKVSIQFSSSDGD